MTKEEAKAEINKVFEPAFANYIITALTEGATPSERKTGRWSVNEVGVVRCPFCHINMNPRKNRKPKYCDECGAKME